VAKHTLRHEQPYTLALQGHVTVHGCAAAQQLIAASLEVRNSPDAPCRPTISGHRRAVSLAMRQQDTPGTHCTTTPPVFSQF
jgi:hypothetical protein